jgi:hypothetical protein
MGAGVIAAACFWLILARIAQAAAHDGKMSERLHQIERQLAAASGIASDGARVRNQPRAESGRVASTSDIP